MAILYITEYVGQRRDPSGWAVAAGSEPAIATQAITYTGVAAPSAALNVKTRFVRLHSDGICSLKWGAAPVAVTTDPRYAAGVTEFVSVNEVDVKAGLKVSAIVNT
jgi:hypothetical protein